MADLFIYSQVFPSYQKIRCPSLDIKLQMKKGIKPHIHDVCISTVHSISIFLQAAKQKVKEKKSTKTHILNFAILWGHKGKQKLLGSVFLEHDCRRRDLGMVEKRKCVR